MKKIKKKNQNENINSLDLKIFAPSLTNIDYFDKGEKKQKDENSMSYSDSDNLEENEEEEEEEENNIDYKNLSDAKKRERKIGYIIEKVYAWRKLYNGYLDDNDKFIKYPLEEAAKKIGVSKKSLDDYLLQIRFGRKCEFNFDENKNEKIGTLRTSNDIWKNNHNVNIIKRERKQRKTKEKKGKKGKSKGKEEKKEQKNSNLSIELKLDKSASKQSSLGLKRNKSKSKSFNLK